MKKVAILLTSLPQIGGEHSYLMILMKSLIKFDKKKYRLLAICCNYFWTKWCRKRGITYIYYKQENYSYNYMMANARFPAFFKLYNTYNSLLGKLLSKNKIDLLISGQQGNFIPQFFCRTIQPVHDLMHRYEPDFEEIMVTYTEREKFFSSKARIADVILVDSKLGKKQYLECYFEKRKHNARVEVLPFVVSNICKKHEEYIDIPVKYIFYPAQFWEHKNHKNLILAIKILKEKIPDIHLILVGSEKNSLRMVKSLIQKNLLGNHISILGFVSDEQLVYLYKHAVAMVMPTYFGPTNIPPLEAMALGCPVIVSNKYAMGEQVGEAGLLFNPDSSEDIAHCIMQVWNDAELRQNMIEKGYEQSKKWTQKDFQKRFIKIVVRELNG